MRHKMKGAHLMSLSVILSQLVTISALKDQLIIGIDTVDISLPLIDMMSEA
jgi:hypothetical protein